MTADRLQGPLVLAGRVLIAALFVPEGWHQLSDFEGTAAYIASAGVPLPQVCAAISVAVHLGFGLMLAAGWNARWAALGLAIFVVAITPLFHHYWTLEGGDRTLQQFMFWKNGAIVGGLLLAAALSSPSRNPPSPPAT